LILVGSLLPLQFGGPTQPRYDEPWLKTALHFVVMKWESEMAKVA